MSSVLTLNGNILTANSVPISGTINNTTTQTNKTVTPNNTQQIIVPDNGYDNLGQVTVNAIHTGSVTAPSLITGTNASFSIDSGVITLQKVIDVAPNVTDPGYISYGTLNNSTVRLSASLTGKSAATYTPTTTNQTIAGGQYLEGSQTILGDANLVASNIKKGVTIFNKTGTYEPKNTQIYMGSNSTTATSYTALSGVSLTVAKTGTYAVKFTIWKGNNSTNSTGALYRNGTALEATRTARGNYGEIWSIDSQSLTEGDVLQLYAKSSSTSYTTYGGYIIIREN